MKKNEIFKKKTSKKFHLGHLLLIFSGQCDEFLFRVREAFLVFLNLKLEKRKKYIFAFRAPVNVDPAEKFQSYAQLSTDTHFCFDYLFVNK